MTAMPYPGLRSIRRVLATEAPPTSICQLCGVAIDPDRHRHVLQTEPRDLQCSCVPCHLLFTAPGAAGGRWRAVPDRWLALDADAVAWDALDVPVGVAFFVVDDTTRSARASYPGPAGVAESSLPLHAWADVARRAPQIATLAPEVEAVLVRGSPDRAEAYIVPIDACYELAGRLRGRWEGSSGGPGGPRAIDDFFAEVRDHAARGRRR